MDLRLDYMHPAEPKKPIFVSAKVYRNTANVIFCRGSAWQGDEDNPIAHCVATFMKVDAEGMRFSDILRRRVNRLFGSSSKPSKEALKGPE
jgi:hypothetical protein